MIRDWALWLDTNYHLVQLVIQIQLVQEKITNLFNKLAFLNFIILKLCCLLVIQTFYFGYF